MSKKSLLEEGVISRFGKLAGLPQPLTKKFLKEEASGRGATFNPHGEDKRFENLDETDVKEEGKDLEQEGKDLEQEGKDLEQEGKHIDGSDKGLMKETDLEQEGKELEQEAKSLVAKPTKIKGGQSDAKLKAAKTSSKNSVKESAQLKKEGFPPEPEDEMSGLGGGEPQVGMEPDVGGEDLPPAGGGSGDIAGLVRAIADAISAHTGVPVEVEGAGVGDEGGEGLPPPPSDEPAGLEGGDDSSPGIEDDEPIAETGIASPRYEDRMAKAPAGRVAEAKKQKDALVAEITNKVISRLAEATKAKKAKVEAKPTARTVAQKQQLRKK